MRDAMHEAVTEAQKAEALEACEAILGRWTELEPLAEPLRLKRAEITARYEKAATSTDQSTGNRQ